MNDIITEPITDTVTAQQVKALKNADRVVFRLYKGQATVEAIMDASNPRNSTGFEQQVIIYAGGVSVHDYAREHTHVPADEGHRYSGFEMFHSAQYSPQSVTLLGRIRTGATLRLYWVRANNNEILNDKGLVQDQLSLVIEHNNKRETYLVAVRVGYDNSARMVKLDWNGV